MENRSFGWLKFGEAIFRPRFDWASIASFIDECKTIMIVTLTWCVADSPDDRNTVHRTILVGMRQKKRASNHVNVRAILHTHTMNYAVAISTLKQLGGDLVLPEAGFLLERYTNSTPGTQVRPQAAQFSSGS